VRAAFWASVESSPTAVQPSGLRRLTGHSRAADFYKDGEPALGGLARQV
jgi:hypothetical protein